MRKLTTHKLLQKSAGMSRFIAILIAAMMGRERAHAVSPTVTDSIFIDIYYHSGSYELDADYRDNGKRLDTLFSKINSRAAAEIKQISIISSASPEGNTLLNRQLSEDRSEVARSLFSSLPGAVAATWTVSSIGIDWRGLTEKVIEAGIEPTDDIVHIINDTPEWIIEDGIVTDGRKLRLKLLDNNRPWQIMEQKLFPDLRVSRVRIIYSYSDKMIERPVGVPVEIVPINRALIESEPVPYLRPDKNYHESKCIALRTNLAYDLVAIPAIGVELPLPHRWSAAVDGYYAWWSNPSKVRYWRVQGAEFTVRKYFGHRLLSGHHVGVYSQVLRYDICRGKRGYLSGGSGAPFTRRPSWGVGVEYGYSAKIGRRLRFDMSLGVGWLTGRYLIYEPIDGHSVFHSAHERKWIGPTRLELALVWLIGKGGAL